MSVPVAPSTSGLVQLGIKAVLATFGTTPEAILDIVFGKFSPSGKMPFSTPISDEAAQNQQSDVPGYMEGDGYALFKFDEGMEGFKVNL